MGECEVDGHKHESTSKAREFRGAHVKHLVTTKVKRDKVNKSQLTSAIDLGTPAIRIEEISSDKAGAIIDDDEFGLVNAILLCLGARMMITKNCLCIPQRHHLRCRRHHRRR